jgi:hypothetical protein
VKNSRLKNGEKNMMWFQNLIRFSFIIGIGIAGVGIMSHQPCWVNPLAEKAAFAMIGLFITGIAFIFLYLNKDVLSMFDGA